MDDDIVERMRAEEADLARKLRAVRDLLAAYGQDPHSPSPSRLAPKAKAPAPAREKVGIDGFGNYGRRIVANSMMAMLTSAHPIKTREILKFLEAMNIEVTGANKVNAVGALLSRSRDIISHGKSGWEIADRRVAEEIVAKYGHKENEPHSETAGGSDAGNGNAPTFPKPWENPQSVHAG